jgi:hypothetical protein
MSLLHRRIALAGAGLAVTALTLAFSANAALAGPSVHAQAARTVPSANAKPVTTHRIQAAAGWLATQFVDRSHLPAPDGDHFDQKFGHNFFPNFGENADAVFGLAAGKAGRGKVNAALDYLVDNIDAYTDLSNSDGFGPFDGSIGKLALAAIVAGRNPAHLGGHDLLAALAADECPNASTTCTPGAAANIFSSISESFVILAESRASGSGPSADAVSYFLSLQCANGGFTSGTTACGSHAADVDATSYAIMALTALGDHPAKLHHAVVWLRGKQHARGYWVSQQVPNTNSTGLAAAALNGARRPLAGARRWLRSQQIRAGAPGAGGFRYAGGFEPTTNSATSSSVLATAQALTGLVDRGSLAVLRGAGSTRGTALFAPTVKAPGRVRAGAKVTVTGTGFAAGEEVTMTLHGHHTGLGAATFADPSGVVRVRFHLGRAFAGTHTIKVVGVSSALVVRRNITVIVPS